MINTLRRASTLWASMATVIFAGLAPAFSQTPTDAQRSAIRSECRSDYEVHCASVPPGGAASLQCLQKNMSSLSSGCQTAVRAVEPPAAPKAESAPAAAPKTESKIESKTESATAKPAETAAPATPKAAADAPAKKPSSAQVAAVRSACRSDYQKVCAGVPTGGAAALQCLEKNKSKVSPVCEQAVNAASGGTAAPAAGGAAATAATASPANLRETRRLLAAKGEDQLDQSDRQRDVAEQHRDLVRGMPFQPCKLIETVEEIQDKEDHPEQLDAAANQAMTQIAEQNDRRLVARDMRARRDDQRPDDHLFDVTEYFLGSLLDMLRVKPKPPASDIHGFSL